MFVQSMVSDAHVISYVLIYLSACLNPIIYVTMNRQFRQAYKSLLFCSSLTLDSRKHSVNSVSGKDVLISHCKSWIIKNSSFDCVTWLFIKWYRLVFAQKGRHGKLKRASSSNMTATTTFVNQPEPNRLVAS